MIELTEAQRQAVLHGEPVRLTAAEIGEDVVLLRATAYDALCEALADEQEKAAWAKLASKAVDQWATDNAF